ncbi:hypothetical protein DPEC_G00356840 [Dallia pectoralis]|uniref:Uncharacterized protein n=1 Tax=Dallia pectoralis TaxID=75939 RepID=A0ACC2EZU2_DALPE|nr:hypothetical protein DPEC_G00356840 [Dallia pectoralis]
MSFSLPFLTVPPTSPSLRSEVFKPCIDDKDLAFCLNEGECSIIETVAGVHRHCSVSLLVSIQTECHYSIISQPAMTCGAQMRASWAANMGPIMGLHPGSTLGQAVEAQMY